MSVITVSQLNAYIASKLYYDEDLQSVSISGEISNFVNHRKSGHFYFTLKDNMSSLKCVMFKSETCFLKFIPEDGQQVIIRGRVRVFERDGIYQLYAHNIERQGVGDLHAEFERLKLKLEAGGFFDRKRPIPVPSKICIITAKTGAAIRDMLSVLERRYPVVEVILISALVQGKGAPDSLVSALETAQETDADVIIIGRGGGSIEDLWAFNDEKVALAVYNSRIPTISAVGHETDFTICDFTADMRAATPSAAAELAVPDIEVIRHDIAALEESLKAFMVKFLRNKSDKLNVISNEINMKSPLMKLKSEGERLLLLENKIKAHMKSIFLRKVYSLKSMTEIITALSPVNVLTRGYAIAFSEDGTTVKSSAAVKEGDVLKIRLHSGELTVKVIDKAI